MQKNWLKTLWKTNRHSAFTDLVEYQGQLLCCFREASNHVSPDGRLVIVQCDLSGQGSTRVFVQLDAVDLRDPKLSIMPDGKLLLCAYGRCFDRSGNWLHSRPICWFSSDGLSWSTERWFGDKNWWLWRLTWYQGLAYGLAYNRSKESLHLYSGQPLRSFYLHQADVLSKQKHALGYPNESDLCFSNDGQAIAIVRRDADSFSAQMGLASFPYKQWKWHDLGIYIGAPAILLENDNNLIVAGRIWQNNRFETAIWQLELASRTLRLKLILPSAGDNSYPGLVRHRNSLYVSYYSSHLDHTSAIYLASLSLE